MTFARLAAASRYSFGAELKVPVFPGGGPRALLRATTADDPTELAMSPKKLDKLSPIEVRGG
jgi:hypothetical protein